jgi:uncharacterized protein (DUF427 family)
MTIRHGASVSRDARLGSLPSRRMGLMYGRGPFSREPAGAFNFEPPPPGSVLYLEPSPKRVRVVLGGEVVADSRSAMLLHESGHQPVYYFPSGDVRSEALEPSDRVTHCPKKGEAAYFSLRVGERFEEAAAWYYADPIASAPPALRGMIAFYFRRMDRWLEEDEEIRGHPRDPYHRIDILRTSREVRVSVDGFELAHTRRARALFETGLPTRWYIPREDVTAELLSSETTTHCPYKGDASYHSVAVPDGEDLVWYYPEPFSGALPIAGLLAFYNERVDIELDGEAVERPASPWRHASPASGAPLTAASTHPADRS